MSEKPRHTRSSDSQFSSWDSVRTKYLQEQNIKRHEENLKRRQERQEELDIGGELFELRQDEFVAENEGVLYNEFADVHDSLHKMGRGDYEFLSEHRKSEGNYEREQISDEDFRDVIKSNKTLSQMDILSRKIRAAESGGHRDDLIKEYSSLAGMFNSEISQSINNGNNDIHEKLKSSGFADEVMNRLWEQAEYDPKKSKIMYSQNDIDREVKKALEKAKKQSEKQDSNPTDNKENNTPDPNKESGPNGTIENVTDLDDRVDQAFREILKENDSLRGENEELKAKLEELLERVDRLENGHNPQSAQDQETGSRANKREREKKGWFKRNLGKAALLVAGLLAVWGVNKATGNGEAHSGVENNEPRTETVGRTHGHDNTDGYGGGIENADKFSQSFTFDKSGKLVETRNLTKGYNKSRDTYYSQKESKFNFGSPINPETFKTDTMAGLMESSRIMSMFDYISTYGIESAKDNLELINQSRENLEKDENAYESLRSDIINKYNSGMMTLELADKFDSYGSFYVDEDGTVKYDSIDDAPKHDEFKYMVKITLWKLDKDGNKVVDKVMYVDTKCQNYIEENKIPNNEERIPNTPSNPYTPGEKTPEKETEEDPGGGEEDPNPGGETPEDPNGGGSEEGGLEPKDTSRIVAGDADPKEKGQYTKNNSTGSDQENYRYERDIDRFTDGVIEELGASDTLENNEYNPELTDEGGENITEEAKQAEEEQEVSASNQAMADARARLDAGFTGYTDSNGNYIDLSEALRNLENSENN